MSKPIERNIDFLDGAEKSNVPLTASLIGFKQSFIQNFGIRKFPLVMHDNPLKAVKKLYGDAHYPYGYFRMNNLVLSDEISITQNIRRMGSSVTLSDLVNATVNKNFMFAADITIECKLLDNDMERILDFVQKLAIINACRLLSFDVKLPSGEEWNVNVKADTNGAAIPSPMDEDEAKASVYEIDFSYTIQSKIGISKEVAKINNLGTITTNVGLTDG